MFSYYQSSPDIEIPEHCFPLIAMISAYNGKIMCIAILAPKLLFFTPLVAEAFRARDRAMHQQHETGETTFGYDDVSILKKLSILQSTQIKLWGRGDLKCITDECSDTKLLSSWLAPEWKTV